MSGWWDGNGTISGCVAAYQPIGAATLAASYTNKANPGTYDAAPGTAPTFAAADGWTFNGTTQYLTTGIVPTTFAYTYICRFSNASGGDGYIVGAKNAGNSLFLALVPRFTALGGRVYLQGGYITPGASLTSGVMAISGGQPYLNGSVDGAAFTPPTFGTMPSVYIGARNASGSMDFPAACKIQAVAIYGGALTSGQVSTVSAAMALLPTIASSSTPAMMQTHAALLARGH